jgi:hypothetical protein
MEKYYSNINPTQLLHIIFRNEDFVDGRIDIIDSDNFLQCSALRFMAGRSFPPHKHIERDVTEEKKIAQEGWVVLKGQVRCTFYDTNDTIIDEPMLYAGDVSFTLRGGHTYLILQDDTRVLEFKTGPYLGQANDKEFIVDPR